MADDGDVYDLGEVGRSRPRPRLAPRIRSASPRPVRRTERTLGPAVAGSLSLFFPGAGQIVAGDPRLGLGLATGLAFLASLVWAILASLVRLVPTLELLGAPPQAAAAVLAIAVLAAASLHLGGVLHAYRLARGGETATVPHPVLAALASLLVPGWGQILSGHLKRGAIFLASAWALAAVWIAVSPPAQWILALARVELPAALREGWGPVALVSVSAVVWFLAVYDAAAGARAARN